VGKIKPNGNHEEIIKFRNKKNWLKGKKLEGPKNVGTSQSQGIIKKAPFFWGSPN